MKQYDWDNIKIDYYNYKKISEICKKYKIGNKTITNAIKNEILIKRKITVSFTEEQKEKISKGRSAYLSANPDKHPWRTNNKFISKPCEHLKKYFIEHNILFVSEYNTFENLNYSIDIALPDKKIGLEINGNQHYTNEGQLKEYYIKRENELRKLGWNIIQIHYLLCYDINVKNELINIIKNKTNIEEFSYTNYKPQIKNKTLNKILQLKIIRNEKKQLYDNKQLEYIKIIKNSSIDFSMLGWVNKVAILINKKPQKVNIWMKKYMTDFYINSCYKRNSSMV